MTLYAILRDAGAADDGIVFATTDEIERDDVLAELRASITPGDLGLAYHPDLIVVGDRYLVDHLLGEAREAALWAEATAEARRSRVSA